MTVCLYIRLSSADKDLQFKSESESIANQRALLHQYLRDHREFFPYEVVEFVDDGFSGTTDNRPGFERMIEFLKDGGSKLVLCKDLSRFFRDYVEIGDYLERIFPYLGVRLIAVNDGYDSDDYKGTTAGMDVVMRCIVYGYYSQDLSMKVRTALTSRARKGQYTRGVVPYGYQKDPQDKHHLVPDPVAAPIVQRIFAMAISGMGTGEIARTLNHEHYEPPFRHFHRMHPGNKLYTRSSPESCWTAQNVCMILQRLEYTGSVVSGKSRRRPLGCTGVDLQDKSKWIIVPECHEALVTPEDFEKAQCAIRKISKRSNYQVRDYLLRSLVRCGVCGRTMLRCRGKGKRYYYRCDKSRFVDEPSCPLEERFYEDELERIVVTSLSQLLQVAVDEDKRIREAVANTHGTAEHLRRSIQRAEQHIKQNHTAKMAAYERYSDGHISRDEFTREREKLAADMERLTAEKASLEEQLATLEKARSTELRETAEAGVQFLRAENVTNEMLQKFIDRVLVFSGGEIEIVYRFSDPFQETLKALTSGKVK